MEITKFEEKSLAGKYGPGLALASRIIVNLGEFFEAPRTVRIRSAQISGVSVKTGGKALESVLDVFTKGDDRVQVPAYLNPAGFDLERHECMGVDDVFLERQKDIIGKFMELGIIPTLSCTPYLSGLTAKKGDVLAWAESSAVSFANSYYGARTNRESGLSALSAAMMGTTPYYGLLVKENRAPTLLVETEREMIFEGDLLYVMGLIIGREGSSSIPYIRGVRPGNVEQFKGLGAAMAATGNVSLYHVENETPEWKWARSVMEKQNDDADIPSLTITAEMIEREVQRHRPRKMPSLMVVGCPHSGIEEIIRIDRQFTKPVRNTAFWIFTSRQTRGLAARMGLVGSLGEKGVEIFADTCMVVSPLEKMDLNIVVTNSGKALHYLPRMGQVPTFFMPLEEMIGTAQEGSL